MSLRARCAFLIFSALCLLTARGVAQAPSGPHASIGASIGVLVVKNFTRADTVRLLNEDGSVWHRFTFYYDDSDGTWDYPKDEFDPRAFHPDYSLLAMDVLIRSGDEFTVVVNADRTLTKQIKKADFLSFLSWEQYVLSAFAVTFDVKSNPLRVRDRPDARTIPFNVDAEYHPVSIRGDWLRVKWGAARAPNHGWIRWKSGRRLLVTLYPFA